MSHTRRSQPARDRILAAARSVFARSGFDRATVREIAAEAKVNPSMIARYYGSKEGLFAAASVFDLRLPDLTALPRGEIGSTLVGHFLSRWDDVDGGGELSILLRASVSHEVARAKMCAIFETQLTSAVAPICGALHASECAALVAAQMLGLALTRYVLGFSATRALAPAMLQSALGHAIQHFIDLPPDPE